MWQNPTPFRTTRSSPLLLTTFQIPQPRMVIAERHGRRVPENSSSYAEELSASED